MKRFQKLAAMLLAVTVTVMLFGAIHVFGATEQTVPDTKDAVFYSTGEQEQEGDISVPIYPQKTLKNISIHAAPSKQSYRKGEPLDLSGLVVMATYSDNSTKAVTGYQVSGFNPNTLGNQTVTISLSGKTATFDVSVYMLGDVDGNGEITSVDATLVLQHVAGWNVSINSLAADCDGNNDITSVDATLVLQYVAGWNVPLG